MNNKPENQVMDNQIVESKHQKGQSDSIKNNSKKDNPKNNISKNSNPKTRFLQLIMMIICFGVFVGCAIYLGNYFLGIKKAQDNISNIRDLIRIDLPLPSASDSTEEQQPQYVDINGKMIQYKYADIYAENSDFIGWITIEDTLVDYPVMQSFEDNEYYINRNFEKTYDGSGLPFLDNRCTIEPDYTSNNLLIYGHNMKSGTMFAQIMKYGKQDFYDEHPTFTFNTIYGDAEYEVIAAFYSQIYSPEDTSVFKYYNFFGTEDEAEFDQYVDNVIRLSSIETGIVPEYGDELITLSTCAYNAEEGRFAVVARKKD